MYQHFIGIDISKLNFVVALQGKNNTSSFSNDKQGFNKFYQTYKTYLSSALIILETTGGYEVELITYLQKKGATVHRASTVKVKNFIRSYGTLAKTDAIDAFHLAQYGFERHSQLEIYQENPHKKLYKLVKRRDDLKQMLVQEKNRAKAPDQKEFKKSFEKVIHVLEAEMNQLQNEIDLLIDANAYLKELKKVLKTIQGIGDITASQLIALLPELGRLDRKKNCKLSRSCPSS